MSKFVLQVHMLDGYLGMVLHGISSESSLARVLRGQVEAFCRAVSAESTVANSTHGLDSDLGYDILRLGGPNRSKGSSIAGKPPHSDYVVYPSRVLGKRLSQLKVIVQQ